MVEESPSLILIPNIPAAMVELMVSAGASITYQQLVAASHSQVEGVHVWVTAQQQLGQPQDMPHPVEAVCRYGDDDGGSWPWATFAERRLRRPGLLDDLTLDKLIELLYITLNMLPAGISTTEDIVDQITLALRNIDSHGAMQLCKIAMQICSTRSVRMDLADRCIGSMLKLQRLSDLPTPDAHYLLVRALQLGVPPSCWHKMCEECQVVQFNNAQSQALLAAAVTAALQHASRQTKRFTYLTACSKLAGVLSDDADSDFVGRLLCAAVASVVNREDDHGGVKMRELWTALPAVVNEVRVAVIAEAIQAGVQDSSMLRFLLQQPAEGEVRPVAVLQALKAAVGMDDAAGVSCLLKLEGTADVSAAETAELIILAVVLDSSTLDLVCQLPAAGDVGPAAVFQALRAAIDVGNADSLSRLVRLEGAAGITAVEVAELINAALGARDHQEGAVQVTTSLVSQDGLMPSTTQALPNFRLVYFLCQLKEAGNIPGDRLAGLLQKAVHHGDLLDVQALVLLPGACQLERALVRQLVVHLQKAARSLGSVSKERALTRLQSILLFGSTMLRR